VSGYTREEAAERAGVSVHELDRLVDLGVVRPDGVDRFSAGEIRKVGLATALTSGGLPIEGIAHEIESGQISFDFLENPVFDHFSALGPATFADLSAESGIPAELLMVIREAIGSAMPLPTDRVREIELPIVRLIEAELASGYAPAVVERLLRTLGDSLRRYVLAEADAFRFAVIEPVADRPGSEIGAAAASATERLTGPTLETLLAIFRAQQAHAWTANMLEGFERDLVAAGLIPKPERHPAMCFLDITGYTRLTDERGDAAAAELAERLGRLVQRSSVQHGGRPVKWLGDGVMFWFREPALGVLAALEMAEAVVGVGLPPAHVGLHSGPVLFQDGDYYGQTVNLASRIADYARPGEILVSQAVVDASADIAVTFSDVGPAELKGVAGSIHLHVARRSRATAADPARCPIDTRPSVRSPRAPWIVPSPWSVHPERGAVRISKHRCSAPAADVDRFDEDGAAAGLRAPDRSLHIIGAEVGDPVPLRSPGRPGR
jgi:adenylate cyclase